MEKVMAQIAEAEDRQTISKSVIKSEIKSMKKVSKLYRALQIVKYNTKLVTYKFIKRTVDICAGLVGTMLLLPIMAVVKIAYLKQGDRAPILFKQKRIGKDGKEIEIYKIRSMVCNAEEVLKKLMKEDPKIRAEYKKNKKLEHDPRVTKIGKFLRKTSLDEFRTVYQSININLQFIFILYLTDTVISYLLTYKRSILQANQKNYVINIVHFGYIIIMNTLQIIYLMVFKEFVGYLIIKIICRLLENIIISIIADKKYSYIKSKDVKPVSKRLKKSIYIRVKGLLFHKIGGFIVLGSDNIIISMTKTLGVGVVGLYSNYYMIISALNNLFGQIFTSLTASVGNLLVEANNQKTKSIYKSTLLLNSWLYSFAAISMFFISVPFVKIWLGNEYVLSQAVVLTLVINFYINGMRRTYATFKEAAGVFYEDRYVPIIESVVNIVVSIVLANVIGLAGVFIGTIASNMVLFLFSFPKFVYKKILHGEIKDYIKENLQYAVMFAVSFIITYVFIQFVKITNNYLLVLIYGIICLIIPNLIFFIVKHKTDEFKYYKNLAMNMKSKFLKR